MFRHQRSFYKHLPSSVVSHLQCFSVCVSFCICSVSQWLHVDKCVSQIVFGFFLSYQKVFSLFPCVLSTFCLVFEGHSALRSLSHQTNAPQIEALFWQNHKSNKKSVHGSENDHPVANHNLMNLDEFLIEFLSLLPFFF